MLYWNTTPLTNSIDVTLVELVEQGLEADDSITRNLGEFQTVVLTVTILAPPCISTLGRCSRWEYRDWK